MHHTRYSSSDEFIPYCLIKYRGNFRSISRKTDFKWAAPTPTTSQSRLHASSLEVHLAYFPLELYGIFCILTHPNDPYLVAEGWVQFLDYATYTSGRYGQCCTALLGFFPCGLHFIYNSLHEKTKSCNLNPEFCRLHWEFSFCSEAWHILRFGVSREKLCPSTMYPGHPTLSKSLYCAITYMNTLKEEMTWVEQVQTGRQVHGVTSQTM